MQGSGKLIGSAQGFIEGKITNGTGVTLKNVYIAYNYPAAEA